jgi:hypothetical protein
MITNYVNEETNLSWIGSIAQDRIYTALLILDIVFFVLSLFSLCGRPASMAFYSIKYITHL